MTREEYDAFIENVMSFLVRSDVEPVLRDRFKSYLELIWHSDKLKKFLNLTCTTVSIREEYDAFIENVMSFLVRSDVEPVLRDRFKSYLELIWHSDKAYSLTEKKGSIFHDLPPHVYQDIVARQRSKYILCVPFMKVSFNITFEKFLKQEDLKNLSSNAKLFYACPNEILLNTGDISNELYVIKQGMCEVLSPVTRSVVAQITAKHHFGVVSCLLRVPAFYTIRAVTHIQVFSISRKYLLNLIETPQIKDALDFSREQPEFTSLQLPLPPFIWYTPPAPTPCVQRFPLPRKHIKDHDFLHPFTKLGVFSVLRYIFPRFTIRPDGPYLARYEWFRAVCALLSALLFPTYSYLGCHWTSLTYLLQLLDFTAYFDILQRILVGYYNEKGLLVYHPASTAAHYLKGAFVVDLIACAPLEYVVHQVKESSEGEYTIPLSMTYLSTNRLLQLYRIPSAMVSLTGYVRNDVLLVPIQHHREFVELALSHLLLGGLPDNFHGIQHIQTLKFCSDENFNRYKRIDDFINHLQQHIIISSHILDYYKFNWEKMSGLDYRKCPILNQCDVALLRLIGRALSNCHFLKDTTFIASDDVISDLYLVDQVLTLYIIFNFSMFGNLRNLSTIRSPMTICSISQVHLLHMNATTFHMIMEDFPQILELLKYYIDHNEDFVNATEDLTPDIKDGADSAILTCGQRVFRYIVKWKFLIQIYLILVSLICIYTDVYNAGFQDNRISLVTVYKCVQKRHESISMALIITTTMSVCIWMTLFIHISTCMWHLIEESLPTCTNKYVCSLYFVLCTVTQNGVGDIIPKTQHESVRKENRRVIKWN
ncbi:unnamed protein product [Leptidea sinapis]|uniref:Cyclic nucleotide-binding domain-containing protein n=1 Tax=Leptidea sinapis TaxID=189913 RepID=A0A5E4R4W7_9NEOP|nr:unnamed protein product [Leptidea sinapis]